MQISIRYFTTLREITGKKEEKIIFTENQKITIDIVLKTLSEKYGNPFITYIFDTNGQMKNYIHLLINGTNITVINEQEIILKNGDTIAILPPIGGG